MTIKHDLLAARPPRGERALALGSVLGALAASSCCVLPLVLFSLGVSGAWIGHLTRLAPYQHYILAATLACLAVGYWRAFRAPSCVAGETCAAPLPNRLTRTGLIVATVLVIAALGLDFIAPLFADP